VLATSLGGEQDHGVVEHGRATVDLLVGRRMSAVAVVDAADGGGEELNVDLSLLGRGLHLIELGGVHAVGDQDADLAAGEAVRPVGQDAQRRGGLQIADRLPGRGDRRRQSEQAEALGHRAGQIVIDVEQPVLGDEVSGQHRAVRGNGDGHRGLS